MIDIVWSWFVSLSHCAKAMLFIAVVGFVLWLSGLFDDNRIDL